MRSIGLWVAGLMLVGSAVAADKSDFSLDKDATRIATAPSMDNFGGDAESLTSLRGTGKVRIGGDVKTRYVYTRTKAAEGTFAPAGSGPAVPGNATFSANAFETQVAALRFQVDACDGGFLTIKLDIDDGWNGAPDQDDFLEEIYFTLESICGTGLGAKIGKMEMPFGMDKDVLLISPYLHFAGTNAGDSALSGIRNGGNRWGNHYGFNDNGSFTWLAARPGEYDNNFGFAPYWKSGQWLVEAAIYQDGAAWGSGRQQNSFNGGFRETNDPGLSFAARVTWSPTETLKLMASGVTRYNRQMGDLHDNDRAYGTSLAFDWNPEFFCKKFNFFGEWEHGWNPTFTGIGGSTDFYSDDIHVGGSVKLTEAITLFAQYEWLRGKSKYGAAFDDATQTAHRAIAAVQYAMLNGMYLEAGYQREWGKIRGDANVLNPFYNGRNSAYADTIYAGLCYGF